MSRAQSVNTLIKFIRPSEQCGKAEQIPFRWLMKICERFVRIT